MSTLNRPPWPHSSVEVLARINKQLLQRLNSDPQQRALWTVDPTQFELSRPGALRIIWSIIGGRIQRGAQYQGPDMPARCIALRNVRLQAEIRTIDQVTVGITPNDLLLAEEVLRQIIWVWDQQRPADFDEEEQQEIWDGFDDKPGQRQIICRYQVTIQLMVLDDPWLFKTIESIEDTGRVVDS